MEYSLYNKMKNIVRDDINYLKSFQIGSGDVENIVGSLLANKINYDTLNKNIDTYIDRLKELYKMIHGDNNDGMLSNARKLQPSSGDIQNIFDEKNNFGDFVKKYKEFLEKNIWNEERLSLDSGVENQDDPTKYDIFYDLDKTKTIKQQIDDFNQKIKIIYDPYIIDKTKSFKENIIANLNKIKELIKISKEFNSYIQQKRQEINTLLQINYVESDLKFTQDMTEPELISFENIKLDPSGSINIQSIKEIEKHISDITNSIEINQTFNKIGEINIIKTLTENGQNLNNILSVDDVITLKSQKGGNLLDERYYIYDINLDISKMTKEIEYLFELLDNIFANFDYMKELQYRHNFYVGYLFLIVRETAKNLNMQFYQYLSKDKVLLYQHIFENIKRSFATMTDNDTELHFLNKYHYITLNKLNELMKFILSKFPGDDYRVDIIECVGEVNNDLILFNHFRQIIIKLSKTPKGKEILNITDEQIAKL